MPPPLVHIHIPLHSQVRFNGMGTRDQRLPQIVGMAPKSSVKGKGKDHTPLSTFGTGPQVSPYRED